MEIAELEVQFVDAITMMEEEVRPAIVTSLDMYKSEGILIYENHDLGGPYGGERFAIGYGPQNTLTELPTETKNTINPPRGSVWQYYLAAWAKCTA